LDIQFPIFLNTIYINSPHKTITIIECETIQK